MDPIYTSLPTPPLAPEGSVPSRVYRVPPEAVQVYQTRALGQLLPVLSVALLAGLLVGYRGLPDTPVDFAIGGLMLLGLLGVGTITILRLIRRTWEGYELVLAGETLIQRQASRPEIRLRREQVTGIQERPGRGLLLRAAEPGQSIHIPAGIDGYTGLRAHLAAWAPVEKR